MRESETGLPAEFCVGSPFSAAACAAAAVAAGDPLPWKECVFVCLVLCWSLHGAMEPLKKILDNENIMIELQALHLWSLAFLKSERFEAKSSSSLSLEISKHRCARLAARPIDHKRQQLKVLQLNSTDLQQWNWSTGPKISCLLC